MEFSVTNTKDGIFHVDLNVTEETMDDAVFYLSMGLSRVAIEFITTFCSDSRQANTLHKLIDEMCKSLIDDFINNGTFEKAKAASEEYALYRYMENVFDDWLKLTSLSKKEFEALFADSQTLHIQPLVSDDTILIYLSSGEKKIVLREFPKDTVTDRKALGKEVDLAYIIAVVAGDILFGDEENPIRQKYCAGYSTLIDSVLKLLK